MLAKRIIPSILSKNGLLVKGRSFSSDRVVGNALQAARIHAMRGVDEILLLDVTATAEDREPDYAMVRRLAEGCFSPLTVGGGVVKAEHVRGLLCAGADKVLLGSEKIKYVSELSHKFGKQCITVSVDCIGSNHDQAEWEAMNAEANGAGEILLQSVYRDGTMEGYDIDLIRRITDAVGIPVIASGGCKDYNDMYDAIQAGADAVAVGALFQYTQSTPKEAAAYLHSKGIEVRHGY